MFEKNLTDLIRGIRANKKHEQKYIATCLQEIHQEVKCNDPDVKAMAISKLTYVMSSPKFIQKRTGYLAAAQSFRQDTDVLMLTTNLLKKDLASGNHLEVGVALNGLSHLVTPDLARDLCQDLVSMLNHSRPYIRKKVVLVLYKIFLRFPEALRISFPRLKEKLDDPDPSVVCAVVNVICELARKNPKNYLSLAPQLFRLLSSSQNNWMLIKIIKLFGALTPLEPRLAKKLLSPITIQIQTTSAMSLLYECIHTVITGGMLNLAGTNSDSLAAMCVSKLITFLEDADQNLKYVGLLALAKILPTHTRLVSEHRDIILKLIDDPDISIRLRALDLVVGMVNKRNLTDIVKRLMSHLLPPNNNNSSILNLHSSPTTLLEPAYRADIITRIIYICSQNSYSNITSFEWYIAVLIDITKIAGVKVGDMLTLQMMDIGVRVKSSRDYCVKAMQNLLSDSKMIENCKLPDSNSEVLYAAAWIVENPQETIKHLIQPGVTKLPHNVQAVYVHAILKIYSYWSNNLIYNWNETTKSELIEFTTFLKEKTGVFCSCTDLEVQERAYNVREIFSIIHQQLMTIEDYSTEQTNIYSFENKAPSVITELSELFFSYELNPVAPKAQKKVPIPEGLDLDTWINEPLPDTDGDSSEEQLEESYGHGYGQKLGGSGDLIFSSGNDTAFGRRRRRKERKERNKNDPYYIEVDNVGSIKKSKSNTLTSSHSKNENIDVDLIPVVRLTMDEFDFKSIPKKSKSKKTKKGNKKDQSRSTTSLSTSQKKPQTSASLTTTPVIIYTDIGEMPENATISDDEKDTTKEIFEQKIWNNGKSIKAGGILDVDFSGIANVDLSTPLGEDEKLPQITVYASPEESRIKEVERVKKLLVERQAKILSEKSSSSKKSSKIVKSKTKPSTKSTNSKSLEKAEKASKKTSKKKANKEASEKPKKKKKEAITTTTTTKKKKKETHSENQESEKGSKSSKLPIKTLIDSENFKITYTLRLAASVEIKNEAPLLYVNFVIINKCSMNISQMSFTFESTSDINFESKVVEVVDALTVNGEKEISIPFKVLGIVGVGLEVTGTFNYTIQITNENSTVTNDKDNININNSSNSIPIKFELPVATFMLDIPKLSPDEFISYVSKTSDFPFTGSTSYHLRSAIDPNNDINNSIIDKPIEEIFHNSLENLTTTATGTNIVEQVTGAITFYGKSVQGYQVAGLAKLSVENSSLIDDDDDDDSNDLIKKEMVKIELKCTDQAFLDGLIREINNLYNVESDIYINN
nr:2051_t:CDS:10 [Entrophospora candida]